MRALLSGLLDRAPEVRQPALERELALLDSAVARGYGDDERLDARVPDVNGLGGATCA